jgi:uncharacterized protein
MPISKNCLPDVNVWLAAAARRHAHHQIARAWLDGATDALVFCRITQMGFLRLITNPKVMGEDLLTPVLAWEAFQKYLADSRIVLLEEPADLETNWQKISTAAGFTQNMWTDAYLAAFANSGDFRLVTFDGGIARFTATDVLVLQAPSEPKSLFEKWI